ncbi:DUF3899 domain-containing protein [Mesomycoplasma molare]|uniref:DUF3899 domain-containing protein n=1 Tax=Mesomycoplasma molare TaxID=171288 RepID=A0ABY5TUQ1_9BACT|nr:DUF3899 domain-containing protein [Mesomycoplasma molare]UWD34383.1 DUF3899 domain-containing protein [Mesomycoplasma molare]
MKNNFSYFWKNKIIRKIKKLDFIYLAIWTILFTILFFLMIFSFNKISWYDALFNLAFLILAITILSLVIKFGLFDIYSRSIKNWNIKKENKILKENRMQQKELISPGKQTEIRKEQTYLNIIIGLLAFIILFIISAPFVFS